MVYFSPEARPQYDAAGLRGGWMGYFASRSAAMGPVPAAVVTATFHNFQPAIVARAIPDAWTLSTPERVLQARQAVADLALRRLWGDAVDGPEVREAADALLELCPTLGVDGRALFAAHTALPTPDAPHLALWHACTLLREHRFDGHVAVLTAHGLDGLDSLVTAVARGGIDAARLRMFRGWTDDEWNASEQRLRERGVIATDGSLTAEGAALRDTIEDMTDALAAPPWTQLPDAQRDRLLDLLAGLATRLKGDGGIVYPNPIGVPEPS